MAENDFKDFGDLYRAAYAESNAERKLFLMSQVQRVLDDWAQTSTRRGSATVADTTVMPISSIQRL